MNWDMETIFNEYLGATYQDQVAHHRAFMKTSDKVLHRMIFSFPADLVTTKLLYMKMEKKT